MMPNLFANILFPPACVSCRNRITSGVLCDACSAGISVRDKTLLCGACHTPLADIDRVRARGASDCHPDFPFLLGAAADYGNPTIQALIHHLKFRSISRAAEPLGDILYKYAHTFCRTDCIVIPIPLSRRRRRSRGYNQAELIARRFASRMALPVETGILIRTKHAKPQSDTRSEAERLKNIIGVFAVAHTAKTNEILAGKCVILVDDVSTTGATFLEATHALKSAGAGTIMALAVAKT